MTSISQAPMSQNTPMYFNIHYANTTCTQGAMYRFMTGGCHDSGSRTLMIVSRLTFTVILIDCSSFIRHLWQSTKHIKWSSKVKHKNNIIRAYNHTTYITWSYSASQVSCTHILVVWISSNQFHVSHLGQYCHWCLYMVLAQCQWRKHGW